MYGEDGEKMYSRRPNQHQHHHENHEYEHAYARGGGFDSDFTAEELFNMFFGGGFPQQRMAPRPRYHNARAESAVSILPINSSNETFLIMSSYIAATTQLGLLPDPNTDCHLDVVIFFYI